jgi:hypothetical protein
MRDCDVIAAARAITPHLPVLVGDDAPEVQKQLEVLLARAAAGESVKIDLLRVLADRASTRDWVRTLLDVPDAVRGYESLPGKTMGGRLPRYACPEGDQPPWFRFDVRDEVPRCPVHGTAFVRADS